jgi:UDP-N-acetylmuramoylalanine--D-glutamate ligase
MIQVPGVKDSKVAVFGLGATGAATVAALEASGADVYAWDDSAASRKAASEALADPADWPWSELSMLVLSPGVPLTRPAPHAIVRRAREAGVDIVGDVELFARAVNACDEAVRPRVIGVTGSNGKSTTTALIGHMLTQAGYDVAVGGNIGRAVLSLEPIAPGRTYVLELSSFQLDLVKSLRCDVAVWLNISPDHLDRHGDMAGYVAAKRRIFFNQTREQYAVIGADDAHSQGVLASLVSAQGPAVIPISAAGALGRGVFALGGKLFYNLDGKTGEAGDIAHIASLTGAHNHQNAAAALAAGVAFGLAPLVAVRAMDRFEGLPHRMEIVGRIGRVVFVNDSKATNADAAEKALLSYREIYWIVGGKPKEGGVASLRPLMSRVRGAYLIGEAAAQFEAQLAGAVPCVQCGDLQQAVARAGRDAAQSAATESVVLLSPACASYDQFKNYEERGDMFRRLVAAAASTSGAAA